MGNCFSLTDGVQGQSRHPSVRINHLIVQS
jgi:hypothetical protein